MKSNAVVKESINIFKSQQQQSQTIEEGHVNKINFMSDLEPIPARRSKKTISYSIPKQK